MLFFSISTVVINCSAFVLHGRIWKYVMVSKCVNSFKPCNKFVNVCNFILGFLKQIPAIDKQNTRHRFEP